MSIDREKARRVCKRGVLHDAAIWPCECLEAGVDLCVRCNRESRLNRMGRCPSCQAWFDAPEDVQKGRIGGAFSGQV